ncbi:MAG: VTT domain-containing protein [Candidatus Aenigmatarchaeota archaeon]
MLEELIKDLSYLGFFVAGLISSSTIFFPIPFYFLIAISPKLGLNPYIAALFSAAGATLGELTSYFVGQGISSYAWNKLKENKTYKRMIRLFEKYGSRILIVFSFSPLPFDFIGIMCGFLKYDLKKFLIITFIGKLFKMLLIAYFGEIALHYIGW